MTAERATTLLGAFRPDGARTTLHTTMRRASAPLGAVAAELPTSGHILDVGCGHGVLTLLAALRAPQRVLTGVDIDAAKLRHARAAAERLGVGNRVRFRLIDSAWSPSDESDFDAIVCTDVLYLLGHARAETWVGQMASRVRPGGRLVIKEMGSGPPWKVAVNHLQELIATRVLSYTQGDTVALLPHSVIASAMQAEGLVVRSIPMDRGRAHPHLTIVGDRPALEAGVQPRGDATEIWRQSYQHVRKDPLQSDRSTNHRRLLRMGVDRLAGPRPVLDLGSGDGNLAPALARIGLTVVVGLEPQEELVAQSPNRSRTLLASAVDLPIRSGSLTGVVAMDVLHHLSPTELVRTLDELGRVLPSGGYLFICEPSPTAVRRLLSIALHSPLARLTSFTRHKRTMVDAERATLEPWLGGVDRLVARCATAGFWVELLDRGVMHLCARFRRL